jgi:peptidyl-prolyl cis-trans isomerase D
MLDIVRENKRVAQGILALITLPFAFWGVESYVGNISMRNDVAQVAGTKITMPEFQRSLQDQQNRIRQAMGGQVDAAMLESPEIKRAVVENLVQKQLLLTHVTKSRLSISDEQLARFIASVPALQDDGHFSKDRYAAVIASQNMSQAAFEHSVRQDLATQQALLVISEGTVASTATVDRWLAARLEEREVAEANFKPEQYLAGIKVAPAAVQAFYDANAKKFDQPEQLRAEFVVFSREQFLQSIQVSDNEVKAWYDSHADRYRQAEERRASHILIPLAGDADANAVKAVTAQANELLGQLRKTPGDFAKVAKQYSKDPGSADRGGDLGWFGRGTMLKAFEEAAFALKEGQMSEPVRSDYGVHIIRITGIKAEQGRPLAAVRNEIVAEIRAQGAAKKYAEIAEGFSNTVYEQPDSLAPAAEKFGLKVQQSNWLTKGVDAQGPLSHPKLMAALFSPDAIQNKRNTEAVEVKPAVLVAARVLEYKPAAQQPLTAVAGEIEKFLARQEAQKQAVAVGQALLAKLRQGDKVAVTWSAPRFVAATAAASVKPAFQVAADKLPAYAGNETPAGYTVYRVSQLRPYTTPVGEAKPIVKSLRGQYLRAIAEEEQAAWLATLRERYPVELNLAVLEDKSKAQ